MPKSNKSKNKKSTTFPLMKKGTQTQLGPGKSKKSETKKVFPPLVPPGSPSSPDSMSAAYDSEDRSGDFDSPSPRRSSPSTPRQYKRIKGGKPYKKKSKRRSNKRRSNKRRSNKRRSNKRSNKRRSNLRRRSKRGKMEVEDDDHGFDDDDFGDKFLFHMINEDKIDDKVSHARSYEYKRPKKELTKPPPVIRYQFKKRHN